MGFVTTGIMNEKGHLSDFSSQSVICSVDKFVKAVDTMNETVMVPSRLLNVDLGVKKDVPELLKQSTDPYSCFSTLNTVKNSLVWGLKGNEPTERPQHEEWHSNYDVAHTPEIKGHTRRISTVSMTSLVSNNSDGECERLSDGDSGVEGDEIEAVSDLTESLRSHLIGLQSCLGKLTSTAHYITESYVEEVSI